MGPENREIELGRGMREEYMLRWCSGLILARKEQEGKSWEPVELLTRVQIPAGALSPSLGPVAQHGRASGFYPKGRNQNVAGSNPVGPTPHVGPSPQSHALSFQTQPLQPLSMPQETSQAPSPDRPQFSGAGHTHFTGVPRTSSRPADELIERDLAKVDRLWRC